MMPMSVEELSRRLGGALSAPEGSVITGFATDSRDVKHGDAFLAIRGERVDGHLFAAQAILSGAVLSVVEQPVAGPHIFVANLVEALARFAYSIRTEFKGPVIGVTGSAGKTTTKEFAAAACATMGPVLKTEGNRNSEFTSPLLWADWTPEHKSVVVEMGMRGFGQIQHLAAFSMPNIAIVTNIGYSHIEFVGSRDGIAQAKGEILERLPESGSAILWQEDEFLKPLRKRTAAQTYTFGFTEAADCRISNYHAEDFDHSEFDLSLRGESRRLWLPHVGRHLALNAAAAVLAAVQAGADFERAVDAIPEAKLPPMRMEVKNVDGVTILLDAYNASPPSVVAALETVADIAVQGRRVALLGEMKELGDYAEEGHRRVGRSLRETGFDEAVLVGATTDWIKQGAVDAGMDPKNIHPIASISEAAPFLDALRSGDTLLIKGSRALELERALKFLGEAAE